MGLPVDAVSRERSVENLRSAVACASRFLLSTPNLNFLIAFGRNEVFRESVLGSEFCTADGVTITLLARLLDIPLRERVTGADLLEMIRNGGVRPLRVFFFGGEEGAAAAACDEINRTQNGVTCVGYLNPGWGSIAEMSSDEIIGKINSSQADFLIVALGAQRGQEWLWRNRDRLSTPVRAHLGAAVNFITERIKRAPPFLRKIGLEWLWRIKEEPHLWKRYASDSVVLAKLLLFHAVPLSLLHTAVGFRQRTPLRFTRSESNQAVVLSAVGSATVRDMETVILAFQLAAAEVKNIHLDLSGVKYVDARFLGALLMLRKVQRARGLTFSIQNAPALVRYIFRLNRISFLLSNEPATLSKRLNATVGKCNANAPFCTSRSETLYT